MINRDEITEQLVALRYSQPTDAYGRGVRDLARLLVDGHVSPELLRLITDSQGSPWAEVLPEVTKMRPGMQMADDNTTNASDTRNSGDEFIAEWNAAQLDKQRG